MHKGELGAGSALIKPIVIRTDIQVLRGFAVLIVVLYHAKVNIFNAGYFGVDIFFVISGFLITNLIKNNINNLSFSFSDFYFRRAKRLLPAAYVTFFCTLFLAPFFLASIELNDFRMQMIGAITFTENIILWRQSGYFEGSAELKPLLHIWSLAIEEQYYFLLPAMMYFVPRKFWTLAAVFFLFCSLSLCLYMVHLKAGLSFYLLPTRGWELAIGSIGAFWNFNNCSKIIFKVLFLPAIFILIFISIVKSSSYHPGFNALLVCLCTIVIIKRDNVDFFEKRFFLLIASLGTISYSLYLVHWPIFAFTNNMWFSEGGANTPLILRLSLVFLSLFLAFYLHKYVELPLHKINIKRTNKIMFITLLVSISMMVIALKIPSYFNSNQDFQSIRRFNQGFSEKCQAASAFKLIGDCSNASDPEVLVWGDSYAMHLIPGLASSKSSPLKLAQATRGNCGPILGIAQITIDSTSEFNENWAIKCIEFNDSVFDFLSKNKSIKIVVLSSPFEQFVETDYFNILKRSSDLKTLKVVNSGVDVAIEGMRVTIVKLHSLGKKVIIVAPPPRGGFNMGLCVERLLSGLPTLGNTNGCKISHEGYQKTSKMILEFLAKVPLLANVNVISFDDYLCKSGRCETYIDGKLIYRDSGHLSYDGSILLENKTNLASQIISKAK